MKSAVCGGEVVIKTGILGYSLLLIVISNHRAYEGLTNFTIFCSLFSLRFATSFIVRYNDAPHFFQDVPIQLC